MIPHDLLEQFLLAPVVPSTASEEPASPSWVALLFALLASGTAVAIVGLS